MLLFSLKVNFIAIEESFDVEPSLTPDVVELIVIVGDVCSTVIVDELLVPVVRLPAISLMSALIDITSPSLRPPLNDSNWEYVKLITLSLFKSFETIVYAFPKFSKTSFPTWALTCILPPVKVESFATGIVTFNPVFVEFQ